MVATISTLLWIQGIHSSKKISMTSAFAAELLETTSYAEISAVYCFCTFLDTDDSPLAVVQNLTLQSLALLETEEVRIPAKVNLSEERFTLAKQSLDAAWGLLEDVIKLGPSSLVIAIDCLERFDDDPDCERLVERLLGFMTRTEGKVIKVLLTSKRKTTQIFEDVPENCSIQLKGDRQQGSIKLRRRRLALSTSDSEDTVGSANSAESDVKSSSTPAGGSDSEVRSDADQRSSN